MCKWIWAFSFIKRLYFLSLVFFPFWEENIWTHHLFFFLFTQPNTLQKSFPSYFFFKIFHLSYFTSKQTHLKYTWKILDSRALLGFWEWCIRKLRKVTFYRKKKVKNFLFVFSFIIFNKNNIKLSLKWFINIYFKGTC